MVKLGGIHPVPHFSQMCMFVDTGERSSKYQSHDVKSVVALKTELQNTPNKLLVTKATYAIECNATQLFVNVWEFSLLDCTTPVMRMLVVVEVV